MSAGSCECLQGGGGGGEAERQSRRGVAWLLPTLLEGVVPETRRAAAAIAARCGGRGRRRGRRRGATRALLTSSQPARSPSSSPANRAQHRRSSRLPPAARPSSPTRDAIACAGTLRHPMGKPRNSCALPCLFSCLVSVLLAQRVKVLHEVTGYMGKEVVLPCEFAAATSDIKVSQVTWVKESGGRKQNVAVYHPDHGPSYPMEGNQSRIHFRTPSLGDATLVINPVRMADEATYTCEFATYPLGNEDGATNLIILANPTNTAEAKEVKVGNTEQPVAICTSAHGKPPARITWQSTLNGNASVSQVMNADGTVTVISQYSMVPTKEADGQPITCVVYQQTLLQPESIPVTLSILYPPEVTITGYDDNWYLSRSDATLTCSAKGNPLPSQFIWSTTSGPLPASVEVQGDQIVVHKVDASVNTTFICQATNRVGQVSAEQVIFVRDKPNPAGAGTTGGIIGGLIAAIVAVAVVVTGVLICRQQQKNRMDHEEDDLEGPPAYKPPPPCQLSGETEPMPKPTVTETIPLKMPYLQPSGSENLFGGDVTPRMEEAPRYHELPTLEEREGTGEVGPSLEDEYLDQINPIYDGLDFPAEEEEIALTPLPTDKAFVMSRAMYV